MFGLELRLVVMDRRARCDILDHFRCQAKLHRLDSSGCLELLPRLHRLDSSGCLELLLEARLHRLDSSGCLELLLASYY
jgi:hypothetical protein